MPDADWVLTGDNSYTQFTSQREGLEGIGEAGLIVEWVKGSNSKKERNVEGFIKPI